MHSTDNSNLITLKSTLIITLLTLLCFTFFTWILRDFVPLNEKQDPIHAWVWSGFTAAPITGVFWFAANMFSVVFLDAQKRKNK